MEPVSRRSGGDLSQAELAALLGAFWTAPDDAYFTPEVIACVLDTTPLALAAKRWRGEGLPYYKPGRTPLYKKGDVISYIEESRRDPQQR